MVLGKTADFGGSIEQRTIHLCPSCINGISIISSMTSSDGICRHDSHHFYLEGRVELVSSSWVPELPSADAGWELAFLYTWFVSGEVAHTHVVLFDALFVRDDFHVADCSAENLAIVCSLAGFSYCQRCKWLNLSSWTRCCWRGGHWLWQIPELSHLPCYGYWSRVHHGHHWTLR